MRYKSIFATVGPVTMIPLLSWIHLHEASAIISDRSRPLPAPAAETNTEDLPESGISVQADRSSAAGAG